MYIADITWQCHDQSLTAAFQPGVNRISGDYATEILHAVSAVLGLAGSAADTTISATLVTEEDTYHLVLSPEGDRYRCCVNEGSRQAQYDYSCLIHPALYDNCLEYFDKKIQYEKFFAYYRSCGTHFKEQLHDCQQALLKNSVFQNYVREAIRAFDTQKDAEVAEDFVLHPAAKQTAEEFRLLCYTKLRVCLNKFMAEKDMHYEEKPAIIYGEMQETQLQEMAGLTQVFLVPGEKKDNSHPNYCPV